MTPLPPNYRTKGDWLKDAIVKHDSDECLMWPFAVDRDGYGRVCFYGDGKKERVFAHRVSFRLTHGRWPSPMGLHKCDTPGCFNPRHIFEGTGEDNHDDQLAKGRQTRGSMQAAAKLTEGAVSAAKEEYTSGLSFGTLAIKYGVSKCAIRAAIHGTRNWKHVGGRVSIRPARNTYKAQCKRGHVLNEETCYVYGRNRHCKTCASLRAKTRNKTA